MSLEIANLNKHFADKQLGQKHVLKDVTFNAENGRIVGLIGKNGSGKTTTFHCILKFIKYDGLIRLDGKEINENTYNRIGYLPEERSLMPKLTAYEQVRFLARLKGMSNQSIKDEFPKWMDRLDVVGKPNDKIKSLSKGNQQKVQLIATLIHKPDFIILDEPFSGLDPLNTDILKKVIFDEQRRGATIIFSDHSMSNVSELCDDVVMINDGRIVLNGPIQQVRDSYGLTRIIVRCALSTEELRAVPHVLSAEKRKDGGVELRIEDEKYGSEIFNFISKGSYVRTFDHEPPTLDEIFKEKAGEKNK